MDFASFCQSETGSEPLTTTGAADQKDVDEPGRRAMNE
jgi:hypothetical protein